MDSERNRLNKNVLKKCKPENVLRLAKFLGLQVSDSESPGRLAWLVSTAIKRRRRGRGSV